MKYWKFTNKEGKTTSVQSCSNDAFRVLKATEVDKTEFDEYLASLPKLVVEKPRDLVVEIDDLKTRVKKLEEN